MVVGVGAMPIVVWVVRHASRFDRQAPYLAGALVTLFGVIHNFLGNKRFSFRPVPLLKAARARREPV
jgi:putative flippase GtrA